MSFSQTLRVSSSIATMLVVVLTVLLVTSIRAQAHQRNNVSGDEEHDDPSTKCHQFIDKIRINTQAREVIFEPDVLHSTLMDLVSKHYRVRPYYDDLMNRIQSKFQDFFQCVNGMAKEGFLLSGLNIKDANDFRGRLSDKTFSTKEFTYMETPFGYLTTLISTEQHLFDTKLAYLLLEASRDAPHEISSLNLFTRLTPSRRGFVLDLCYSEYRFRVPTFRVYENEFAARSIELSHKLLQMITFVNPRSGASKYFQNCSWRSGFPAIAIEAGNEYLIAGMIDGWNREDKCT